MEAVRKRNIKPGYEYDNLFPRSEGDTKTIRKNANVSHTVEFIPKVVQETLNQTKQISQLLKGKTLYETCKNIWHFVYQHINYKKDQEGFEQIRSPARAWHDRKEGVDCDCYSVFISSILTNLGIAHILRITKYHRDYFQHIYPIVPNDKRYITIDCVTDKFDYEVPFSEKKDYPMELQYLNGFDGDGMGELGKIIKKNMAKKSPTPKANKKAEKKASSLAKKQASTAQRSASSSVPAVKKKKGVLKKVVNAVNKVNPATVLLRNGILAAMKLNVKNVAQRLRWSYLTPQQATAKNIDPEKFQKLIETRQKLEKIFFGAGGKVDNLKKAILSGKGNKDKAVSGLGMLPMIEWNNNMSEYTALNQLLGSEIYYSENIDGMEGFKGFHGLGEPVTLATVGAAMGVIAGIVAALKQIGDIFKAKQKDSEDFDESKTDATENNVSVPASTSSPNPLSPSSNTTLPATDITQDFSENRSSNLVSTSKEVVQNFESNLPTNQGSTDMIATNNEEIRSSSAITTPTENSAVNIDTPDNKESFWDKNKKWLKPVAIGVGGLTLIAIGFKLMGKKNVKNKSSGHSLSGVPHKRKKKKKHKHHYKKSVALL